MEKIKMTADSLFIGMHINVGFIKISLDSLKNLKIELSLDWAILFYAYTQRTLYPTTEIDMCTSTFITV